MKTFIFLFIFFTLGMTPALAQKKVAVVKLLRGDVDLLTLGKTVKLQPDQWVEEGSVVKTAEKSFVKLVFVDKSQMNIGPNSEMKIESFSGKDSGVIDLVKGKIRSQVTKDYLQMEDKNKSKLFIKTANAVMGVRGTDFMISSNGRNSSVVLFEGEVVFNKLDARNIRNSRDLEHIVDRGVRMFPGEFSVVEHRRQPTVPSLLNVQQRESLEKNDSFDSSRGPSNDTEKGGQAKSVVPAGLNGETVSNNSETLKKEVVAVASASASAGPTENRASKNPDAFVQGEKIKPANGSFLHVDSGVIIPPAPDSVLDGNSNTYVAGTGNGSVAGNGDYVPPKNVEITSDGKILVATQDGSGGVKVVEVQAPSVLAKTSLTDLTVASNTTTLAPPPTTIAPTTLTPTTTINNDLRILNQVENTSAPTTNTTIRVKPN